jgi:hypothetical protein
VSIRLPRLDERTAELAAQLFPFAPRHADLVEVLRRWGQEDVELSGSQVRRILEALRTRAIPVSRAMVRSFWTVDLRTQGEEELSCWLGLEALLAGSLHRDEEGSGELPLHAAAGCTQEPFKP